MMWTTRPRSDVNGGIAGISVGQGDPLVLIHGVGLNADSWGAQINGLQDRFAIHAMDLPGHGESRALAGSPKLADLTDAMAGAIATVERPVYLAGHSLGALIALDLTVRYSGMVRAVAILNAVYRRDQAAQAGVQARAGAMSATEPNDPSGPLRRWFSDDQMSAPAVACRHWLETVDPAGYKAAYTAFAFAESHTDEELAAIACPTLFLTGADEPNSTPAMSEAMAALVPGGRAMIVPEAAHMMMMTHPDVVNAALINWFGENR